MGIKKVVYFHSYAEYKGIQHEEGCEFLTQFGVEVTRYKGKLAHEYPLPA